MSATASDMSPSHVTPRAIPEARAVVDRAKQPRGSRGGTAHKSHFQVHTDGAGEHGAAVREDTLEEDQGVAGEADMSL